MPRAAPFAELPYPDAVDRAVLLQQYLTHSGHVRHAEPSWQQVAIKFSLQVGGPGTKDVHVQDVLSLSSAQQTEMMASYEAMLAALGAIDAMPEVVLDTKVHIARRCLLATHGSVLSQLGNSHRFAAPTPKVSREALHV